MTDMTVELCGIKLKNPIIAASGTFGFGREYNEFYDIGILGAISTKGITLQPRLGNGAPRIAETASGVLNSVGLQNPGVEEFLEADLPFLKEKGVTVIANAAASCERDYVELVKVLSSSAVDMIELNISCPNVKAGGMAFGVSPDSVKSITEKVRKVCTKPLIIKLTPNVSDIKQNALAAQSAGADAVSLVNTFAAMAINANTRRPILDAVTGGLSGACIKPIALKMVYDCCSVLSIPVIGMGGIMSGTDAAEFMIVGATAVQVGTANLYEPFACKNILNELTNFAESSKLSGVSELIGTLTV